MVHDRTAATASPPVNSARLCYNSVVFQQLTSYQEHVRGKRLNRVVALLGTAICLLAIVTCGGNGTTPVGPNGNILIPSQLKNRAFLSNTYSGNLQIVDSANDTTAYITTTNNTSGGTTGATGLAVTVTVGVSMTFESLSPDKSTTAVYDQTSEAIDFVTNSTETLANTVALPNWAGMGLWSPDSTKFYVPVGNASVTNAAPGLVEVITFSTSSTTTTGISASYAVPSVRWIALSPSGNTMLAFADNSDSVWLIDLTQTTVTPVQIPGFARPVGAFFSSDNNTAYILNCGPQCGSGSAASVSQFDVPSRTIKATVPVGGASVGYMNNNLLYVAGYPGGANGTLDIVDTSSMTRTTANSILINDGYQSKMALSNNNKLYIGAKTCSNTTIGCLSIVDLGTLKADPPGSPQGSVTGLLSVPNRNVMYVIQGGIFMIYDTQTGQLQSTQIAFRGALSDVIQIDF